MRYFQTVWFSLAVLLLAGTVSADEMGECLAQGKKEFSDKSYAAARVSFERCLRLDKTHVEALLSLGGVLLTQKDLNGARSYFLQALKYMARNSPYFSYTYSMLGDIALKQNQLNEAQTYYERSLQYNPAYVNSLVGKGVILQAQGHIQEAAQLYQTALAVEPLNLTARTRLVSLEPLYFSDEEILEGLKQRQAVSAEQNGLQSGNRALFTRLHAAEQRGGIDYLKGKYSLLPEGYVVTLFKDTSFERAVLTAAGYDALQKQIGQDAVAVFEKLQVPVRDIFELRDMRGEKIFQADSTLTDSGYQVYTQALQGRKTFLLPGERLLTKADAAQINQTIQNLQKNGYVEISSAELAFIKQQTNCTDEVLRRQLGVYTLQDAQNRMRYFVIGWTHTDAKKGVPFYYTQVLRSRKDPTVKVPDNSAVAMFGASQLKLCSSVDGQLLID